MVGFYFFYTKKLTNQHCEYLIPTIMNVIIPKHKNINLNVFAISFFLLSFLSSNAQVGINTITPTSTLEVNGSLSQKVTAITTTTTLDATYNTVVCNNGSTAITVNLPTVASSACDGRIYTIKKGSMMDSTANVTIDGNGSETIDGATTFVLSDDQGAVTIASDGTEWKIISDHLSPYPMGEISYFSTTGTTVNISGLSDGSTNMIVCAPSPASSISLVTMPMNEFSKSDSYPGRLTYDGKTTRTFHIACTISVTPSYENDLYVFGVAKGGTVVTSSKIIQRMSSTSDTQSTAMHVVIVLAKGEYLELKVGNLSSSGKDVKIKSLNLFALGM